MEALYSKLYDKYKKLKTKKLFDLDELNKDQESKFLNFVSASEELIQHLKSENDRLTAQVNDLRNEVVSIRSTKDEQFAEYQKLLMEENQKSKSLSEEVERLQKLHQEVPLCSSKDGKYDNIQLNTPGDTQVVSGKVSNSSSRKMTRKRSRQSGTEVEAVVMPDCNVRDDAIERESATDLSKGTVSSGALLYSQLPECCKSTIDRSGGGAIEMGSANCLFQALIEYLVGMKLSTVNQTEGICISALHQSSGYSFSLTWVNKAAGESELLYRVSSLGTFERVAPEWMREVLMFSTSMCPIFFERVSRVIKLHH